MKNQNSRSFDSAGINLKDKLYSSTHVKTSRALAAAVSEEIDDKVHDIVLLNIHVKIFRQFNFFLKNAVDKYGIRNEKS